MRWAPEHASVQLFWLNNEVKRLTHFWKCHSLTGTQECINVEKVSTSIRTCINSLLSAFSPCGCNVISCSKFLPCWLPHSDGIMSQETPFPLYCFYLHILSLQQKMKLKHMHTYVKKLVIFSFICSFTMDDIYWVNASIGFAMYCHI